MREIRRVKLSIPEFLGDFAFHVMEENWLECRKLKDAFQITWDCFSDNVKGKVADYMRNYVQEEGIDLVEDLNNEFLYVFDYQQDTTSTETSN